ncbi:hypothetical protein B0T13DRAFT_464516 [Neurospora crassa]|nr:hypothetical protein B0T13DRAFT_464516 [Neurospora crassa]
MDRPPKNQFCAVQGLGLYYLPALLVWASSTRRFEFLTCWCLILEAFYGLFLSYVRIGSCTRLIGSTVKKLMAAGEYRTWSVHIDFVKARNIC